MRFKFERIPLVIITCMKLHNFIIDNDGSKPLPTARVHSDPANRGPKKAVPVSQRPLVSSPSLKSLLNRLPGKENFCGRVESRATQTYITNYLSALELRRSSQSTNGLNSNKEYSYMYLND